MAGENDFGVNHRSETENVPLWSLDFCCFGTILLDLSAARKG